MKPLLPGLLALLLAHGALAQATVDPASCPGLAARITELQAAKASVDEINERSTTSLGVNPNAENFIVPQVMERVDAQRREAEALRQSIESRKTSMFYDWDYSIRTDTERYNLMLAAIKRDLSELQSRQDTALQQIALNKATAGYDRTVDALEQSRALYASRGCK